MQPVTVKSRRLVKPDARRIGQRPKHPIDYAHMKVPMCVQAGAEAVNESDRAQVHSRGVCQSRTGATGLQALLHHAQEDAQCRIECALVALQVVAQAFGHRQHPLAHRQMGEYVVRQVRCCLGHSARVARGANTTAFAGKGHQVVVPAVVTPCPRKAVGKDAALQTLAKRLLDIDGSGVVLALAVEMTGACNLRVIYVLPGVLYESLLHPLTMLAGAGLGIRPARVSGGCPAG